jgi:hypothetical protein
MADINSPMTAAIARELWTYDPATGILRWRNNRSQMKAGDRAGSDPQPPDRYSQVGARIEGDSRLYMVHRVIWLMMTGAWPKADIDHIDGDILNNRWTNLRDVPTQLNCQNQRRAQRNNKSGLLGVTWSGQHGKWRARIHVDGKKRHLGLFQTKEEAHECYLEAKRLFHDGCTI